MSFEKWWDSNMKGDCAMGFEKWWESNKEDVIENCENSMDRYDAKYWLELAYVAGGLDMYDSIFNDVDGGGLLGK